MHTKFTKDLICSFLLVALTAMSVRAQESPDTAAKTSADIEKEMLALLGSEAPAAEKAIACKKLAIYGSDAAVPELAKLLPDPQLSSWARIALEVIPGEAPNDALRTAAGQLDGRLLIGMINSLGVRQDAQAINLLTEKIQADDTEVASAAAVALGHIGNEAATKSLRTALANVPDAVRSAVAEGCILCAERLHKAGDTVAARDIYDEVRNADVPKQRVLEATRGAILASSQKGIPLLLELFKSEDKVMFQLALGVVREYKGNTVDPFLPDEVNRATPERAALIVQAMADRSEFVSLPVVLKFAVQGPKQVRISAIDALSRIGDDTCLSPLLEIATDEDQDLAKGAQQTLSVLPGKNIDGKLGSLLPSAQGERYRVLIQLVGQRRIRDMVPEVEKALASSDAAVRSAALVALGETIALDKLPVLVAQVVQPKHSDDGPVAIQALKAASVRMPDREACATKLAAALNQAPAETKSTILEIINTVGGDVAMKTLVSAAKSDEDQLQDTASRLLGTWNSLDAAPILLDLAKTAPAEKYRVRALRGYIGLARKFSMPPAQRVAMCQNAFDATKRIPERKLVLDVLKLRPSKGGLELANKATNVAGLEADANAAVVAISQKLGIKVEPKTKPAK